VVSFTDNQVGNLLEMENWFPSLEKWLVLLAASLVSCTLLVHGEVNVLGYVGKEFFGIF
jgi:hypothetical protein